MSIAVVTAAVGDEYQALLPAWAEAVAALERQPDEVIIAVDDLPGAIINRLELILRDFWIVPSDREWEHHPQVLVNDAISVADSEWICKMDADDEILPHALTPLDACTADVFMFGIQHGGQYLQYSGVTAEKILTREANLVFSGSPFRRYLWEGNNFRDMIFEDWAFWIGCAEQGATFEHSGTYDYIYTAHEGQISRRHDEAYWAEKVRELP